MACVGERDRSISMQATIKAFHEAIRADNLAAVADLLKSQPALAAAINEPSGAFDSAPVIGAQSREMLDLLLAAGADVNARSRWWAGGFGLLDLAKPELAAYAIGRGAVVDAHSAARLGMIAKLRELIIAEPTLVHARGGDGQTPLHFASSVEIARFLVESGADIDARDVDHESTPAQYMVRDRQEVARYLVGLGCATDLLMAAALGDLELARKHLEANPSLVRMTVSGRWFPKRNPHSGGTIYTWTLGADRSPHAIAREFGHEAVLRYLMERTPETLRLKVAIEAGDEAAVRDWAERQPGRLRELAAESPEILPNAARANDAKRVTLLLAVGWPVGAPGQHGGTALHWAAFHGNAEMVRAILPHNPPLETKDRDFQSTPVGWAVHGSENGWHRHTGDYPGTVALLLAAGAKPPKKIGGTEAVREVLSQFTTAR